MDQFQSLLYNRQFIFCNKEISELGSWNHFSINDYTIYAHPNLTVSSISRNDTELFLLGTIFSYTDKNATNETIIENLVQAETFEGLLQKTEDYCGRYVIIFKKGKSIKLFNDVSAKRKVVYYFNGKDFCCASQSKLIAKYFNLQKSKDPEVVDYYQSEKFRSRNRVDILDKTEYDQIKQLLANWYLDVGRKNVVRFWPYRKLKTISLNEAIDSIPEILQGFMQNIHQREEMMMAVTGGNDSRLLLASCRDISQDMLFFVYQLPKMQDENHPDIVLHKKIMNKLRLKENVIQVPSEVDPDFRKIYKQNNEYAELANMPIIYNFLWKQCRNKINIASSMSDVTRNFFSTYKTDITPELLANVYNYGGIPYIKKLYKEWLKDAQLIANEHNYNILDLYNWEERMTNWSAYYVRDSDIARDEISPMGCRKLLEIMFSVPKKYRDVHTNILHRELIKHMWPELASFSYNPSISKRVSYTLKKAGIYWPVRGLVRGW